MQNNQTQGFVYLLHFFGKIGNASHYTGFAENVEKRVLQHEKGRASKFTTDMKERGINFVLARTWEGPKSLEREIKKLRNGPGLCPICQAQKYKKENSDMVLFPAMGRDYKTVDEVRQAWEADKTFVVAGPGQGYYTTRGEIEQTNVKEVTILFRDRRSVLKLEVNNVENDQLAGAFEPPGSV